MTVIIRPLINEKSMGLTKLGFYTFEVTKEANKSQIAKVVADKFKVKVTSVRTLNQTGKTKTQRTKKGYFKESNLKKAIVKLGKNDKIAIFEHSQPEEDVTVTTAEGEQASQVKEKKSLLKGTKVRIEKTAESVENDQRKLARMEEHTSGTKVSNKPVKKGKA